MEFSLPHTLYEVEVSENELVDSQEQNEPCIIDYEKRECILRDDLKKALKERLENYRISDQFTPQHMEDILGVINLTTNGSESSDYIHSIKDDKQNGFFQLALNKGDFSVIQWLLAKGNINYHSEKECADFILFCNGQLSPTIEQYKRDNAYNILKSVIEHYKTNIVFEKNKQYYLEIMIMLQLQHRALATKFIIEEELLTPFLPQGQAHSLNVLSDMYQKTTDEKGNTLAHIIIEQYDADELHKVMKKNYISKEVKNNDGKTVYDIAFDKHREFTQNPALISERSEEAQATRCCYFMLKRYFAGNQNDFNKTKDCCNQHIVTKRYGIDSDISRNSSSQSISSSSSSSLHENTTNNSQQMLISNPSVKDFSKKLLDDGEKSLRACCWKLSHLWERKETDEDVTLRLLFL